MGTRHLWLALLLALLQYAAVPVGGSGCPGAPTPKSKCAPKLLTDGKCKESFPETCPTGTNLFYSKRDTGEYDQLKKITCGVSDGHASWNAYKGEEATPTPLINYDNVVCANEDPSGCPRAPLPLSFCPPGSVDCVSHLPAERPCETPYKRFISKHGTEPWKTVTSGVCQSSVGGVGAAWKIKITGDPTDHLLTKEDNLVCSKKDPTVCPGADKPKSECPAGNKPYSCVEFGIQETGNICNIYSAIYHLKKGAAKWTKADSWDCDASTTPGKWYAKEGGARVYLTKDDNMVCATNDLALDCMKCPALPTTVPCTDADGCVIGRVNMGSPVGECLSLTCYDDEFFLTDTNMAVDKIKCEATAAEKKWMSVGLSPEVPVTAAVCIKQLLCTKKHSKLTSKCEGINDVGCSAVTFNDVTPYSCPSAAPKMFYHKTGELVWQEATANKIECNKKGFFKHNVAPFPADGQVICATDKPVACDTSDTTKLKTSCDGVMSTTCKTVAPSKSFGPMKCDTGSKLFVQKKDTRPWVEAKIECNAKSQEWKQTWPVVSPLTTSDIVVCSVEKPTVECLTTGQFVSDCDDTVRKAGECKKLTTIPKTGDLSCTDSSSPTLYYKPTDPGPWVKVAINCEPSTGKWQTGGTDLIPITKVICAKSDPNLKSCKTDDLKHECNEKANTEAKCAEPEWTTKKPPKCPTADPPIDQLYFKKKADTRWIEIPAESSMYCDLEDGKWKETKGGAELPKETNVICTDDDPNLIPCLTVLKHDCDKKKNGKVICTKPTFSKRYTPFCTDPRTTLLYFMTASKWELLPYMLCDTEEGKWKAGGPELPKETNVICTNADPGPLSCSEASPLKSACNLLPRHVNCTAVTFKGDAIESCSVLNAKYYVKALSGSSSTWVKANGITCNEYKGEWEAITVTEDGSILETFLKKDDEVICAEQNPNPNALNCLTSLPVKSCDGVAVECVDIVPFGDTPDCSSTSKNLYFKQDTVTTKNWMAATALRCVGDKWQIEHKFGADPAKNDTFADTGKIICAESNPDPIVCTLASFNIQGDNLAKYIVDNSEGKKSVEAGQQAKCTADEKKIGKYDFITEADPDVPMKGSAPVCYPDGTWYKDKPLQSSQISCVTKECRKCEIEPSNYIQIDTNKLIGAKIPEVEYADCASVKCSTKRFASKIDEKYQYIYGDITCEPETSKWMFDKKVVQEFACVQKMPCLTDDFPKVDLMDCPPDYVTNFGCVKVEMFTEDNQQKLRCPGVSAPAPKKMFVKANSGEHWAEVYANTAKCDHDRNKWQIDLVDIYTNQRQGSGVKEFDHENAFICADVNPNPEPTTTTTTNKPILPICEECNATRPVGTLCDKCDEDHVKLNSTDNECTMTAADSNYHLIINSQEEVDALVCVRGSGKWTKKGGTEAVEKAAIEQKKTASTSKLPLILGIIIAILVLAAIGGAIAFVLIKKKKKAAKAAQPVRQEFDDPCGLTRIVRPGQPDQFVVKGKDIQLRGPLFRPKVHNKPLPMKHMLDGQEGGDKIDKIFFAKELNEGFFIGEGVEICEPDSVTVSEGKGDEQTAGSAKFEWDDGMTFSARYKKEEEEKVAKSGKKSSKSKKSKKSKRAPKQPPTPSSSAPGPSSNNSDDKKPAAK